MSRQLNDFERRWVAHHLCESECNEIREKYGIQLVPCLVEEAQRLLSEEFEGPNRAYNENGPTEWKRQQWRDGQ